MVTSRNRPGRAGFSLLEVVIALALLATALMAVFRLQAQNLDLQAEARFMTVATQLTQNRIAQIQAAPDGLQEGSETGDFGEDFPDYQYRQEIEAVADFENLFRVRVSVFLEGKDEIRDLSAETYLYR